MRCAGSEARALLMLLLRTLRWRRRRRSLCVLLLLVGRVLLSGCQQSQLLSNDLLVWVGGGRAVG